MGVGVRLSKGNGLSYDEPFLGTWLFLWPFLFQPLLGVHMLATLVSPPSLGQEEKFGVGGYVAVKTRFDSIRLILII